MLIHFCVIFLLILLYVMVLTLGLLCYDSNECFTIKFSSPVKSKNLLIYEIFHIETFKVKELFLCIMPVNGVYLLDLSLHRKPIFFSRRPEKMVFPKKLRWNMIIIVLSGKMIFVLVGNMILPPGRKMKDDLFQKIRGNIIFSSDVLKRWLFQKNYTEIWPLLYYRERYFFFSKIWSYPLDGKWKMIFLKKYVEI